MSFQSLERIGVGRALAISVAVHLLLLWPAPPVRLESGSVAHLVATLRAPQRATVPEPVSELRGLAGGMTPARPTRLAATRSVAPLSLVAGASQPASSVASTVEAGDRSGASGAAGVAVPAAAEGSLDADGLRGYRLALAKQARNSRRYPRQAEDAGWAGTVEVRIIVLAGGVAQTPELVRSSGHAILDRAALDMLRAAVPATPVPPVLRHQTFAVDLPVVFELPE